MAPTIMAMATLSSSAAGQQQEAKASPVRTRRNRISACVNVPSSGNTNLSLAPKSCPPRSPRKPLPPPQPLEEPPKEPIGTDYTLDFKLYAPDSEELFLDDLNHNNEFEQEFCNQGVHPVTNTEEEVVARDKDQEPELATMKNIDFNWDLDFLDEATAIKSTPVKNEIYSLPPSPEETLSSLGILPEDLKPSKLDTRNGIDDEELDDYFNIDDFQYDKKPNLGRKKKKKDTKGRKWSREETCKFYMSLQLIGCDFERIRVQFFAQRTRKEIKTKFKREDRLRTNLVTAALNQQLSKEDIVRAIYPKKRKNENLKRDLVPLRPPPMVHDFFLQRRTQPPAKPTPNSENALVKDTIFGVNPQLGRRPVRQTLFGINPLPPLRKPSYKPWSTLPDWILKNAGLGDLIGKTQEELQADLCGPNVLALKDQPQPPLLAIEAPSTRPPPEPPQQSPNGQLPSMPILY